MADHQDLKPPGFEVSTGVLPVTSFLQCRICSGVFVDPRLLDCQDTLCMHCIEKLLATGDGSSVKCPMCKRITKLPKSGAKSLSTNSFIVKLVEISQLEADQKQQKLVCSACSRSTARNVNTKKSTAVVYCVDCDDKLCVECQQAHAKLKPTQSHQLVPLGKDFVNKFKEITKNQPSVCTEHKVHPATLYCKKCSKPICLMCAVLEHKTHDYTDISAVAADRKCELAATVEKLSVKLQSLKCLQWEMLENGKMLEANVREMESTLMCRSANFKAGLESGLKYLQGGVENRQKEMLSEVQKQEKPVQHRRAAIKTLHAFSSELAQCGQDAGICQLVSQLACRVETMVSEVQSCNFRPSLSEIVYSKPDALCTLGKQSDAFGLISTVSSASSLFSENRSNETIAFHLDKTGTQKKDIVELAKQKKQPQNADAIRSPLPTCVGTDSKVSMGVHPAKSVGSIAGTQPVYGIAVIGDELLVAYRSNPSVHVYNRLTMVLKRHVTIAGLVNPSDMAACHAKRNIYVSDFTQRKIFRIPIDDTNSVKKQTVESPWGISVMLSTNILVAQPKKYSFAEYTSELQLIRTVKTPAFCPTHVVRFPKHNDAYAICERGHSSNVTLIEVRKNDPAIAQRIADSSRIAKFKFPSHLLIDGQQNILVADVDGHEIIATNAAFMKLSVRINVKMHHPNKICLDSSGQILYTGFSDNMKGVSVMAFRTGHRDATLELPPEPTSFVTPAIPAGAKEFEAGSTKSKIVKEPQLIGTVPGWEPVRGLAVIDNELYVVYRDDLVVYIYNRHTLQPRAAIIVEDLSKPTDLAACSTKRRIYISDRTQQKLFAVSLDDTNSVKSQSVLTSGGISVTSVATVLVAQNAESRFSEYSSELLLLRTVETPGYNPCHVVSLPITSTSVDQFVICEGHRTPARPITLLEVAKTQPDTLNTIAYSSSTEVVIKNPSHLLVDVEGNIVVIDEHRHELITLSLTLSQVRPPLIDRKHTRGLFRACLDSSGQTLYLGTAGGPENGAVFAFKIAQ